MEPHRSGHRRRGTRRRRYIWARIANPTKYANDKWDLTIIADGKDFYEVRKKDISSTTYTVGFRSQRGVTYIACWSKKGEVVCAKSIKWRV